jgi:hypothetical protein
MKASLSRDWKIHDGVAPEIQQSIMTLLDEGNYDPESCGWGQESDSGYMISPNIDKIMFIDQNF